MPITWLCHEQHTANEQCRLESLHRGSFHAPRRATALRCLVSMQRCPNLDVVQATYSYRVQVIPINTLTHAVFPDAFHPTVSYSKPHVVHPESLLDEPTEVPSYPRIGELACRVQQPDSQPEKGLKGKRTGRSFERETSFKSGNGSAGSVSARFLIPANETIRKLTLPSSLLLRTLLFSTNYGVHSCTLARMARISCCPAISSPHPSSMVGENRGESCS